MSTALGREHWSELPSEAFPANNQRIWWEAYVIVHPVRGWWSERPNQDYWDRSTRYSLVVSIRSDDGTIDL